jgi:hypothetical protein
MRPNQTSTCRRAMARFLFLFVSFVFFVVNPDCSVPSDHGTAARSVSGAKLLPGSGLCIALVGGTPERIKSEMDRDSGPHRGGPKDAKKRRYFGRKSQADQQLGRLCPWSTKDGLACPTSIATSLPRLRVGLPSGCLATPRVGMRSSPRLRFGLVSDPASLAFRAATTLGRRHHYTPSIPDFRAPPTLPSEIRSRIPVAKASRSDRTTRYQSVT